MTPTPVLTVSITAAVTVLNVIYDDKLTSCYYSVDCSIKWVMTWGINDKLNDVDIYIGALLI